VPKIHHPERAVTSTLSRVRGLMDRIFHTLHFHEGRGGHAPDWVRLQNEQQHLTYSELRMQSDPAKFALYCRILNLEKESKERTAQGDSLLVLINNNDEVVSFGWKTSRPLFWISEVGISVKTRGRVILYDFYTPSQHQRNGYHEHLLRSVFAAMRPEQVALIFALQTNVPPLRVYAKMGLRRKSILGMLLLGEFSRKRPNAPKRWRDELLDD
jgi:hypothetical protein